MGHQWCIRSVSPKSSAKLYPRRRPPESVAVVVCSQQLVSGGAGSGYPNAGTRLRLSFQVKDAEQRTAVDTASVVLRPLLVYSPSEALPPGINSSTAALPSCNGTSTIDPISGIGECSVDVEPRFFPAAGAVVSASVQLQLSIE